MCLSIFKHFLTGKKDQLDRLDDDGRHIINGLFNVNDAIVNTPKIYLFYTLEKFIVQFKDEILLLSIFILHKL